MGKGRFALYESAAGYALFEVVESGDDVAIMLDQVQAAVLELGLFSKMCKLKSFLPFTTAAQALQNCNDVSEGIMSDELKSFLELNLPKMKPGKEGKKKKSKFVVLVGDHKMGNAISEGLGATCECDDTSAEIIRGIRVHFNTYVKQLAGGNIERAQLGLGHSYSRCKVKFNVNRADNMIIQAICLLDQLDKDLNTFAMRTKEWYSWHFPELMELVKDNFLYAQTCLLLGGRGSYDYDDEEKMKELTTCVLGDEELAAKIVQASRTSMGMELSPIDLFNISSFAERVVELTKYREDLSAYLSGRMEAVAPNLSSLIGDVVGARLISHAGSLVNLAKCPASTVQILGAEKALFRALKTRGNTPKYGLIFHSSFIGRASAKNKGRISRYLANKCSIASRIDAFSDVPTKEYGKMMKAQVDERLRFYDTGEAPRKNIDCMEEVAKSLGDGAGSKRKRDADSSDSSSDENEKKKKKKKKKQQKKSKKDDKVRFKTRVSSLTAPTSPLAPPPTLFFAPHPPLAPPHLPPTLHHTI
jgi:nucleolar protein 56